MKDKAREDLKEKLLEQKWARLEKEGIQRPKSAEENKRRIMEAHGQ